MEKIVRAWQYEIAILHTGSDGGDINLRQVGIDDVAAGKSKEANRGAQLTLQL